MNKRIAGLTLVALIAAVAALREVEYTRFDSPDGRYQVVVTHRAFHAFLPMMPGSSGDKPGFVAIYDQAGNGYGTIPVPMVNMATEIRWEEGRASIKLVGEWGLRRVVAPHYQ